MELNFVAISIREFSVQASDVANLIGAELSLRQVLMLVTWIGCQILTCLFFGGSNPSLLVCVLLFLVLCVNFLCKFVSLLSINPFFVRAFDLFASIFFALSLTVTSFFANFSLVFVCFKLSQILHYMFLNVLLNLFLRVVANSLFWSIKLLV